MHDRGPQEIKWCLSAILALRDSLVVRQVMPRIYRIADIKVGQVFWKQTTSRSILVHTGSAAFPQGSLWRERPRRRRGVSGGPKGGPLTPPRWRTSGQKRGVAPSTFFPPVRRAGRGGDTPGAAPPRSSQPTRGIRANPCPIRLSRQGPDHSSEGAPSEREALWLSKACAT